jgi:abhydrolase domain-containing protein 13
MNEDGKLLSSTIALPNWLINISMGLFGLVGIVLVLLYNFQDKMLYIPDIPGMPYHKPSQNPEGHRNPMDAGNVPYENVYVETKDGEKIHTWLMIQEHKPEKKPTLIYFHGNAGNMGFRLPNSINMFNRCDMNILAMDYRGYGDSTGTPTEKGLKLDAEAVLKHVLNHPKLNGSPIILFGRSLGGAVAIALAHQFPNNIAGIIVENTFLSVSAMVDVLLKPVAFAKNIVLRIDWDNDNLIKDLKCSIMFISGDADELVPPPHMKKLYDLAINSKFKDFYSILGGGHNDSFVKAGAKYYKRLREFVHNEFILGYNKKYNNTDDNNGNGNGNSKANIICTDDSDAEDADEELNEGKSLPTMNTNFSVQ